MWVTFQNGSVLLVLFPCRGEGMRYQNPIQYGWQSQSRAWSKNLTQKKSFVLRIGIYIAHSRARTRSGSRETSRSGKLAWMR